MRALSCLVIAAILTLLGSCRDHDDEGVPSTAPDVENFIERLKTNQYDSSSMPAFTYQDIPELLKYRVEKQLITKFPRNPVSSYLMPECKLGIYDLWTIESIRAEAINSEFLVLRFPSLNPLLGLRDDPGFTPVFSEESHEIAAKAYYDWWYDRHNANFNTFKSIDPLGETPYKWR
jgi:hypothetical protein